jgi:hypothetical protein
MAKSLKQYFIVTIGTTENLVEERTALKAQELALNAFSSVRKATVSDVIRIGADNVIRADAEEDAAI